MLRKQTTILNPTQVSGFGFWSGRDVTIEFRPAVENTGIVFVRADLPDNPRIPAIIHHRIPGPRRTTLVHQGCSVELVEHVMAALSGLNIDNCEVWVNRPEIPGCDGSSQPFVDALKIAQRVELETERQVRVITEPIVVGDEISWIRAEPNHNNEFRLKFMLDYPDDPVIGKQTYEAVVTPNRFESDIAAARTFILKAEADKLSEMGLGRRVEYKDVLVFDADGPIENSTRYPDECARHKLLDMVGDFALLGSDLIGTFTAHRSGHLLNAKMVFAALQHTELLNPVMAHSLKQSA